jgi:glycosyltransferase involved in cell wall biosynthesis
VILVVDGSNDGSDRCAERIALEANTLTILRLSVNHGKGEAVLRGFRAALAGGFTHALVFDADGQHASGDIPKILSLSLRHPEAMVLGIPVFGPDAPALRVNGRKLGNWWTNVETLWGGIEDSLFGFRVYPIQPSIQVLENIRGGRRFDFETQLAVRLYWLGIPAIGFPSAVVYLKKGAGGVSHFHYVRDNVLLVWTHALLCLQALAMLPRLIQLRKYNQKYRSGETQVRCVAAV